MSAPVFLLPAAADAVAGQVVTLGGAEGRHAATVQRREVGERIDVVDGGGVRVRGEIVAVRPGELDVRVVETVRHAEASVVLVQALAKGGRDEQAVETATELGATRVIPWAADRAIVQWRGPKAAKGREKWQAVALAAMKQSRRAVLPGVDEVVDTAGLAALVEAATASGARVLVLHEEAAVSITHVTWDSRAQEVWVVVGPEGGITPGEIDRLVAAGAQAVLVGPHVLRASTAGPAAIAALAAVRGTWDAPA